MNFNIHSLPRSNETLDFYNINIPFVIAQKNQIFLKKYTEKLSKDTEKLRIYTDRDKINVISNGIKDRFYFDYDGSTLNIDGEVSLKSGSYRKETEDFSLLRSSSVINLEEASYFMIEEGFIPSKYSFKFIIKKRDVEFSNMMSLDVFRENVFNKVNPVSYPNVPLLKVNNGGHLVDNSIISYDDGIDYLVHRFIETNIIKINMDSIVDVSSSTVDIDDLVFTENFVPTLMDETVSVGYMEDTVYGASINALSEIYITNNDMRALAPINKSQLIKLSENYISVIDNKAHNVRILDDREEIDQENIISNNEANTIIKNFFYGISDAKINSLEEFEKYLKELCSFDDEYLTNSFSIKGGKIYLGFDYTNMYSIFNSEAIRKILLDRKGDYDSGIDGITFQAARYFKDQEEINKLSAYAETLGIDIDVAKQRLASTFDAIRKVVAKLCILTPDVVTKSKVPDIPVMTPGGILNVVPPSVNIITNPVIFVRPVFPMYISPVAPPMVVIPPNIYVLDRVPVFPILSHQPYIHITGVMPVIPPIINVHSEPPVIPTLGDPAFYEHESICYQEKGGCQDTMVIFDADGDCKQRFVATSNRTLNMIDASAIFSAMDFNNLSYGFHETGHVVTIPEVIAFMLYQTMRCMAKIANIPMNIDFCETLITVKEEERHITGFCSEDSDETDSTTEIKLQPGKYFILNGVVVDENGNVSGEHIITGTEWFDNFQITLSPFVGLKSEENKNMSNAASEAMGNQVKAYVDPVRISSMSVNSPVEAYVTGFENLKHGGFQQDVFMVEYVTMKIKEGADIRYGEGGNSDCMGIWYGSSLPKVKVRDIIAPNIAISIPAGVGVDSSEDATIRLWSPNEAYGVDIRELPYHIISSSDNKNYFVPAEKLILQDFGNGVIYYDSESGFEVTPYVEREMPGPFGEDMPVKGFTVDDKFVVVSQDNFAGLIAKEFPTPKCNAYKLPELRTVRTPLVIVPLLIALNGPVVVKEGDATDDYFVTINRTIECPIEISLVLEDKTTTPSDYEPMPVSKVVIQAGDTESDHFNIQTIKDDEYERNEYYTIKITDVDLSSCNGIPFEIVSDNVVTAIYDYPPGYEDVVIPPPEPPVPPEQNNLPCYMTASPAFVNEGEVAQVKVFLSKRVEDSDFSFVVNTEDGTATGGDDYLVISDEVYTVPVGEYSTTIDIPTYEDDENEVIETFYILLSKAPTEARDCYIVTPKVQVGITDDGFNTSLPEPPPDPSVPPICNFKVEGEMVHAGEVAKVKILLAQPQEEDYHFNLTSYDFTAYAGYDYDGFSTDITIPTGSTEYSMDVQTYNPKDSNFSPSSSLPSGVTEGDRDAMVYFSVEATTSECSVQSSAKAPVGILEEPKDGAGSFPPPCISILNAKNTVEGGLLEVKLITSPAPRGAYNVRFITHDASAQAYVNYIPVNETVRVDAGEGVATMNIITLDDHADTGSLSFLVEAYVEPKGQCTVLNSPVEASITPSAPFKFEFTESAGVSKVGCDGTMASGSGIPGDNVNNISDLSTIDKDTMYQAPGEVPGAVTMGLSMQAVKAIRRNNSKGMKVHTMTMCCVFGAIDGLSDNVGDILSQGYTQSELPSGGAYTRYMGPSPDFISITSFSRSNLYSIYTIDIKSAVDKIIDSTTGSYFGAGLPVRIASNHAPIQQQLNEGEIVVGDVSTTGMITYYKHASTNPKYPIAASYGGSSATSLTTGEKVVVSSGNPMPPIIFTEMDDITPFLSNLDGDLSYIFINNSTITVALKDTPAALSQNRTVKFVWG